MDLAFLDFETYWSTTHSLSKMSALAYVMHPDTELISCSLKVNGSRTEVVFGEAAIRRMLGAVDWKNTAAIGHNMSTFDALILAWRLGIRPRMWGCTLAMARPLHAKTTGLSLGKLVEHYRLGVKDNTALLNTKGKHLADFSPDELDAMARYNGADTDQCAGLFEKLKRRYTARELWHIDATIRMLVEPRFVCDTATLEQALIEERNAKRAALVELGKVLMGPADVARLSFDGGDFQEWVRSQLASAPKFAEILNARGVPTPMKPSPTNPDKQTAALAKTDEAFLKLQDHPDPVVSMAARTRLSVKSTLLETRIEAFLGAARACDGRLPIPLHYCGADTTGRWSGWLFNPQNLPRIPRDRDGNIIPRRTNALRLSMLAPPGHAVVVADLSGIELRVNHFLWKVPSSMRLFRNDPEKADLYKDFASRLYDIEEGEVTKEQRQIGKVCHLGLGFGAGPATFQKVAKLMGGVTLSEGEATHITYRWREEYAPIVEGWKRCHEALRHILTGDEFHVDPWGLCRTERGAIVLPSGRRIYYPALSCERNEKDKSEWWYGVGRHRTRIYSGKIDENCVQALARDVIADCAIEFFKVSKLRPAHTVHDELIYVVPEAEAEQVLTELQGIMRTPPSWWPQLVTWSEGDIAASYGLAK